MGKRLDFDIRPAVESLGLNKVIEQVGVDRIIACLVSDQFIDQVCDYIIQTVSPREIINRIGLDGVIASLSPAERRELKRLLQD